ncbi:MAG: M48 family metalloprotease [Burkholderiaceae bacterium]
MRAMLISCCLLMAVPAFGENIEQVLQRSQQRRLQALSPVAEADSRAAVIRTSFERLLGAGHQPLVGVELRVVTGAVTAECLFGRMIIANASLADMPEGERLFVLAHELGHLINGHWTHLGSAFKRRIPGEVTQPHTDEIALLLGPELSALAHRHEYDADAYGLRAVQQLGFGLDAALASFLRHGVQQDTATHPSTRKRLAHLRVIEKQ